MGDGTDKPSVTKSVVLLPGLLLKYKAVNPEKKKGGYMKNNIRILKIEPGKTPYEKEIPNDYQSCMEEVGGLIACLNMGDGCIAVVNDEGKCNGMEPNRRYDDDIICGPFFICADSSEGEFASLTDKQIEKYSGQFVEIPQFTGQEPELAPRMTIIAF